MNEYDRIELVQGAYIATTEQLLCMLYVYGRMAHTTVSADMATRLGIPESI